MRTILIGLAIAFVYSFAAGYAAKHGFERIAIGFTMVACFAAGLAILEEKR